ncbi:MAG TPA: chlorite dismutase family protein [Chloroflexota bacterium]|nr:chlorite dismutase family protein [Chloroflexota bacterium]
MQYLFYRLDPAWRRLAEDERHCRTTEFAEAVEGAEDITTYAYNMTGLKSGTDLMLWRSGPDLARLQGEAARLQQSALGKYLDITYSYIGLIRPSTYVRRQTPQEQAALSQERSTYLVVYPFSKTTEWYLLSQATRQGMMNEHIKIGHEYAHIRQVLVYSFGLDDQEFIVSYEADDLLEFQSLVMALRATDGRIYTLRDTPIFTCVHRPLREALAQLA